MAKRTQRIACIAALSAALTLGACDRGRDAELAKLDNQLTGKDADPALTSALEDQILVDPALTQQSNANAVRPPETPTQAQYPLPEQRPAEVKRSGAARTEISGGCGPGLQQGAEWARGLPPAFALYPGSKLSEAAGSRAPGCQVHVLTFTSAAAPAQLLAHYRGRVSHAGYSVQSQQRDGDQILSGRNGSGGDYYLILTPRADGGSDVAIIVGSGA